ALKKGHELGSRKPAWPYPSAQWVRQAERLVELDAKLPAFLKGETKPGSPTEQIEMARLCQQYKQLYIAAAGFYRSAFAAQPQLADDLRSRDRCHAACAAALAGCGRGKDADQTDAKERPRLRSQALDWLRADLAAWTKLADDPKARPTVQRTLRHWQTDLA